MQGPTAAEPRARRSYVAIYLDPIGRVRFRADYGTNGGLVLVRQETVPVPSDIVLVSETRYAADGQPGLEIAPDGMVSATTRNQLGQIIHTQEASGTAAERVTRFRWHASGQLANLILENPATGEQVTTWSFGTVLNTSGVARNDLVSAKTYPTGESLAFTYNRQADLATRTDSNGSLRTFAYNLLGRILEDAAVALGAGVDGAVRRLTTTYNAQARPETFTTYNAASGGTAVNQVKWTYNAFGLVITDQQEHSGVVTGSTPNVRAEYSNGAGNVLRRTASVAPNGTRVDYSYGAAGSLENTFNWVSSLKVATESANLVDYAYTGWGRSVTVTYPTPAAQLSYLKPAGEPGVGDAGDIMSGYDRFNRTVRMPWKRTVGGTVLADIAYGYDRASRRTWRQDLTPAAQAAFDRAYDYDALGQVKDAARGTLNENRTSIGGVPKENESWVYDEQGNWLNYDKDANGVPTITQTRRQNESNQILTINGTNAGVDFDPNGNMVRIPTGDALTGAPRKLVWNAWDQLIEVRDSATNALIQRNTYDALYRRITRQPGSGSVIHTYYNDQWRPVEERTGTSTSPVEVYFWGIRHRDDLLRRDRATSGTGPLNESLWCLMDYFDPIAVINTSGAVQERYIYSAFGVPLILAPDYSVRSTSSVAWEFLFHGQFTDAETGYQNYGYRYYLPAMGRWLSRDPIGEDGGANLYNYADGEPVGLLDRLGLEPIGFDKAKAKAETVGVLRSIESNPSMPKEVRDRASRLIKNQDSKIVIPNVDKLGEWQGKDDVMEIGPNNWGPNMAPKPIGPEDFPNFVPRRAYDGTPIKMPTRINATGLSVMEHTILHEMSHAEPGKASHHGPSSFDNPAFNKRVQELIDAHRKRKKGPTGEPCPD